MSLRLPEAIDRRENFDGFPIRNSHREDLKVGLVPAMGMSYIRIIVL